MDSDEVKPEGSGGKPSAESPVADRVSQATSGKTLGELQDSGSDESTAGKGTSSRPTPAPDGQFDNSNGGQDSDPC